MIDEYIEKTNIAINEGIKKIKKGKLTKGTYYRVLEEYFNSIYGYVEDNIETIDDNTLARIYSLENNLTEFIVPFNPKVEAPNEVENSDAYLLETIVYFTRKQLLVKNSVDLKRDSLRKQDAAANNYVKDMCERLGLLYYSFNIGDVFNIPKNHNVCLVKVNDVFYLVDCTYQQYFLLGQNFKDRYLRNASHVVTCEVGARILGRNKEGALTLLERGFISVDDPMFEDYLVTMFNQANCQPKDIEECLEMIINYKNNG